MRTNIIIIGGGQAGLAMGYHLALQVGSAKATEPPAGAQAPPSAVR